MKASRRLSASSLAIICLILFIIYTAILQRNRSNPNAIIRSGRDIEAQNLPWPNDVTQSVQQDDPRLVEYVRQNHIFPANRLPYNFDNPRIPLNPSAGQLQLLLPIIGDITGGFFIELGANDGEWDSNTLYLERELGWNGLLIEASPSTFARLRKKNRKAWQSNVAVSRQPHPSLATFYENPEMSIWGGLTYRFYHENTKETKVQCIPLYTLLLAINQTVIDFFSLDLEGVELDILRTIPFDKVTIKSLAVEVINGKEGPEAVKNFMRRNGFVLLATVPGLDDLLFVNQEFATKAISIANQFNTIDDVYRNNKIKI